MKEKSIGEVAKLVGVEIHTIRFWTEEFKEYIVFRLGKGDRRYYSEMAIEMFKRINHLIHHDGIRIKAIKEKKLLLLEDKKKTDGAMYAKLETAKKLLLEARDLLEKAV